MTIRDISAYNSPEELIESIDTVESWITIYEQYYELREDVEPALTIEDLSGVGPVTADVLREIGIKSISDIDDIDTTDLTNADGVGGSKARHIKNEVAKLFLETSKADDFEIPDGRLLNTLLSQYAPDYESLSDGEDSVDALKSWLDIYRRHGDLYRRAEQYRQGIKDQFNTEPALIVDENHLDMLIFQYSPSYTSLEDAKELVSKFEAWIDVYERFQECYLVGTEHNPSHTTEISLNNSHQFDIPYHTYHPSNFESVDEAQQAVRTLEMATEVITFMSEADPNHPSVDADLWDEAITTALEQQYPDVLKPIRAQIQRMNETLWESENLFEYDWSEFEDLVGILYSKQEYAIEVTLNVADRGVDIWAEKDDERVAIQVKHFQKGNTVGRETLQNIVSTLAKGDADRAVVITSSTFADTAEQYARDFGPDLKLFDHDELIRRLSEASIPPPD